MKQQNKSVVFAALENESVYVHSVAGGDVIKISKKQEESQTFFGKLKDIFGTEVECVLGEEKERVLADPQNNNIVEMVEPGMATVCFCDKQGALGSGVQVYLFPVPQDDLNSDDRGLWTSNVSSNKVCEMAGKTGIIYMSDMSHRFGEDNFTTQDTTEFNP